MALEPKKSSFDKWNLPLFLARILYEIGKKSELAAIATVIFEKKSWFT